jgi:iron complex transport system permease protein
MLTRNFKTVFTALVIALVCSVFVSLKLGTINISAGQLFDAIFSNPETNSQELINTVIYQIRLPRVIAAIIAGAALSVSGAAYQSMFINPLVSPGLLGVLAGAAFGSAAGMLFGKTILAAQIGAFVAGIAAVTFTIALAGLFRGNRLIMLLIGGIVSSSFFTSLISVLKYTADSKNELPAIVYWLMGGFSSVTWPVVRFIAPMALICLLIMLFIAKYLNLLSMGDDEAASLGVKVNLTRNFFIVITTLLCSLTVSLGGIVSWVGLMIPHTARMLIGPDNRKLLPASALIGAIYLLMIDNLCRAAFNQEIPVGIMTSLVGVPFFVLILWKTDRRWN